jgi:hypothetical protein
MIEIKLDIVMLNTADDERWLDTLKSIDSNGLMTAILNLKKRIRILDYDEDLQKDLKQLLGRINKLKDSEERKEWYEQIREIKEYYKQIKGEELNVELPETSRSQPENIITPLLGYNDKRKEGKLIREIQEGKNLHEEIKERMKQTKEQGKEK